MKLRWLLAALGLVLMTAPAQAQVGVYFNPIVTHVSNSQADTGPFAFLGSGNTSANFGGVSFGALYDLKHASSFGLGLDMRDELQHANGALLNGFLVGARVFDQTGRWKPYLQLSVGAGTTRSPLSPVRSTQALFKVYLGADYRLGKNADLRALEIGYGPLTTISSSQYGGGSTSIPAADLLSFSSGLVFHF